MLASVIVYLAAAVVCVPLASRLKLGSVLGYLAAGCIIGPFGLRLIQDPESTLHFAEIGVVLMLFVIGLELKPGADPRAAEASLYQQLARLCDEGITEVELERAKNNLSAHLLRELATNNGRAHALGNYEVMLGGWREGLALAARYESITAREVQNAAQQYLTPHRRSVVTLVPEPQASSEAA